MLRFCPLPLAAAGLLAGAVAGIGQGADPIGVEALRAYDPTLTGSGITVAQPEATFTNGDGSTGFEVEPSVVGQAGKFIYVDSNGTVSTTFDPTQRSDHAGGVAEAFYGDVNTSNPEGVAPGVSGIINYEADYFFNSVVANGVPISTQIVNQSFAFLGATIQEQEEVNQAEDDYSAAYNTLFISGVGNGGGIQAPGSSYNGIGVAAYGGGTSSGPTFDGRSKPDITAPAGETSFAAPEVSGAAAILLQAAARGDAGIGTESDASDSRVVKALLLNGAVKPAGWTHTATAPLDPNYGAGILNVYNSYMNLAAGEHGNSGATSGTVSAINSGTIAPDQGWDLASIATPEMSGTYVSESNHYLFDLSSSAAPDFTLTSTLTWFRQYDETDINNLDLYLFNATTGATIALSDSTIDNVQELYVTNLNPGEYDLVVEKAGGTSISGSGGTVVSGTETYALAFNFHPVPEPSACWLLLPGLAGLVALRPGKRLRAGERGVP